MSRAIIHPSVLIAIALALVPAAAQGQETEAGQAREKVSLSYERSTARRPPPSAPGAPAVPARLKISASKTSQPPAAEAATDSGSGSSRTTGKPVLAKPRAPAGRRTSPTPTPKPNVDRAAVDAGTWAAKEMARRWGTEQYFVVGLWQGQRAALEDRSIGGWDYRQGLGAGRLDPSARTLGVETGLEAAEQRAAAEAAEQVRQQFSDLSWRPRPQPSAQVPRFDPPTAWAPEPELAEVFSWAGTSLSPDCVHTLRDVGKSTWDLFRYDDVDDFYDDDWTEADRAFDHWRRNSRAAQTYNSLRDSSLKQRFREVFASQFERTLARQSENLLHRSWQQGFSQGWNHGALVSSEMGYRKGYTEGFNERVTHAARESFGANYRRAYDSFYAEAFDEWNNNPQPEVSFVELADSNDDGIFEPGEELEVHYELVNYGGVGGTVEVRAEGMALRQSTSSRVALAARAPFRPERALKATVAPRSPIRSTSQIDVVAGTSVASVPIYVSHPLELEGEIELLERDNLRGEAVLQAAIVNRSRRPVAGRAELDAGHRHSEQQLELDLGTLAPGESAVARFEVRQLPTLEMLRGDLQLRVVAMSGSVLQDEAELRMPGVATDLANRDLVLYMVRLATDEGASPAEIASLHYLTLRRMSADWEAADQAGGNPYKQDLKQGTTQTALGDMVQEYLGARGRMRHPEVFAGLADQLEALAGELPGVHPFMRKSFKRLARRLEAR